MLRAKLSTVPALALATLLAGLAGCSSTPEDKTAGWSPNRLHAEAKETADSGAFDKAIPLYEKLEGRAAGTLLAQQAQLEKAYAQYRAGDRPQAIATLDRYIRLHPGSPALDYALYLKGLVNLNETPGLFSFLSQQELSERDQKAAKEAYESFRELLARFPQSRYAAEASARMNYIVNALAQYEVNVARYYFSRKAYVAAINRAQAAVTEYRNVPAQAEALAILAGSYEALGMTQLAQDARRVLASTYPDSAGQASALSARKAPWWKPW